MPKIGRFKTQEEMRMNEWYTDATFVGHVEWQVAIAEDGTPSLVMPEEVQTDFRALRTQLHDRIRKFAQEAGVNIVQLSDVVTIESDNTNAAAASCMQEGAYLTITTYVVHDGQEEAEHEA